MMRKWKIGRADTLPTLRGNFSDRGENLDVQSQFLFHAFGLSKAVCHLYQ